MKIKKRGSENYENEFWCPPCIKENTEKKEHNVFIFLGGDVVSQQKQRKEVEKESYAAENHEIKIGRKKLCDGKYFKFKILISYLNSNPNLFILLPFLQ